MQRWLLPVATIALLAAGCASNPPGRTLGGLHDVEPDTRDIQVEQGLEKAMDAYRRFLDETPDSELTPEAMRRLADLQIESEFGLRGGDGKPREMEAPERGPTRPAWRQRRSSRSRPGPRRRRTLPPARTRRATCRRRRARRHRPVRWRRSRCTSGC